MKGRMLPRHTWRAARLRDAVIGLAFGLPWLASLSLLALRLADARTAWIALVALAVMMVLVLARRWRKIDTHWLVRALNQSRPDLEDSADLLLDTGTLPDLPSLQRQRIIERLRQRPADLRRAWPLRALGLSLIGAAAIALAAGFWPIRVPSSTPDDPVQTAAFDTGAIRLIETRIDITPPAYTRLPARDQAELSLRAPQDSTLRWSLRFSAPPAQAALVLLDGRRLEMVREGDAWNAELLLERSALYRVEVDGVALDEGEAARLEAIVDQPPQVRALQPEQSLSHAVPGQKRWQVVFEATDDYALAESASLRVTHTQGSGENIGVAERSLRLRGEGEVNRRRYAHALDLAGFGFAPGDDLIVQLTVRDTRQPVAQETRGPSLILRWDEDSGDEASDLEGAVKRVLPAYFRSQRQIIIDAEALLKQRPALDDAGFARRSDALGDDQRILRLRYGQFMGEESEGAPSGLGARAAGYDDDEEDDGHGHEDHNHGSRDHEEPGAIFGQDMDLIAAFGHTHDIAEAATLLDARTREVLRKALGEMWLSERGLRQGDPQQALPHARRALDYIKEVQQAERIYLPRLGSDLPPIDFSRRLGGKRDGLASRPDPLRPATPPSSDLPALWRALDESDASDIDPTLLASLRDGSSASPAADPLALQAAIDALLRDPQCAPCRERLRALLWPLLDTPPAAVPRRSAIDGRGARYLDAVGGPAS